MGYTRRAPGETSSSPSSLSLLDPSKDSVGERLGHDAPEDNDGGPCVESSSLAPSPVEAPLLPLAWRRFCMALALLQGAATQSRRPSSCLLTPLKLHDSEAGGVEGDWPAEQAAGDFSNADAQVRSAVGLSSRVPRRSPRLLRKGRAGAARSPEAEILVMAAPAAIGASTRAIAARIAAQ